MRFKGSALLVAIATLGCAGGVSVSSGPSPRTATIPSGSAENSSQGRSTAATLGIPPGHLPPPGQCRIWVPGRPPGHQGRSGPCRVLESQVGPGQWLVYRPTRDKKVVEVRVYDATRPSVRWIRLFDLATGVLLQEEEGGR
jgi:hypothetical protein